MRNNFAALNCSFFKYCDSNIKLLSIAVFKIIAINEFIEYLNSNTLSCYTFCKYLSLLYFRD